MNRKSNEVRQIFMRINGKGKSAKETGELIGVTEQTIHNWRKKSEEELLKEGNKNTQKPSIDLEELRIYLEENPQVLTRELADKFKRGIKTMHKWRKRLGFVKKSNNKVSRRR